MNAVDTNVLIYSHDTRDPRKQEQALSILEDQADGVLIWQVACEYIAACRKLEPLGFRVALAWQNIRDLQRIWTTILPTWNVLSRAENLKHSFSLSFWDALLIAACLEGSVDRLYSEDFGAYSSIEQLEIVNPFAPTG